MPIAHLDPLHMADWSQQLPSGMRLTIVDVRETWELDLANIRHLTTLPLVHIPLGQLPHKLAELEALADEGAFLACLCHHGVRSMQAANFLKQSGLTALANITGGIDRWAQIDSVIQRY